MAMGDPSPPLELVPREPAAPPGPLCPACLEPTQVLHLHGSTGNVEVELCVPCRLVWFDERESLQLSGLGWVELLRRLQHDEPAAHVWSGQPLGCLVCRKPLLTRNNQTKYGRFVVQACEQGHGTLRSEATLLAERGLVREPSLAERAAMQREPERFSCLNCGAAVEGQAQCHFCRTPLMMADLPRLATALRPRSGARELPRSGQMQPWSCHACGQVLDPTRDAACPQCKHPVFAHRPEHLRPVLDALAAEWQQWLAEARNQLPRDRASVAAQRARNPRMARQARAWRVSVQTSINPLGKQVWSGTGVVLALVWAWLLWW